MHCKEREGARRIEGLLLAFLGVFAPWQRSCFVPESRVPQFDPQRLAVLHDVVDDGRVGLRQIAFGALMCLPPPPLAVPGYVPVPGQPGRGDLDRLTSSIGNPHRRSPLQHHAPPQAAGPLSCYHRLAHL